MSTTRSPGSSGIAAASASRHQVDERPDPGQPRFGREAVVGNAVLAAARRPRGRWRSAPAAAPSPAAPAAAGGRRARRCRPRPRAPPAASRSSASTATSPAWPLEMPSCFSARAVDEPRPAAPARRAALARRSPSSRRRRASRGRPASPSGGADLPSEGGSRISIAAILADPGDRLSSCRLAGGDRRAAGVDVGLGRLDGLMPWRDRRCAIMAPDRDAAETASRASAETAPPPAQTSSWPIEPESAEPPVDELLRRGTRSRSWCPS